MSNQVTDCALEQIEELQHYIFTCFSDISYHGSAVVAKVLYHAGYHKHGEGEWMVVDSNLYPVHKCSLCKAHVTTGKTLFCPFCGAKMERDE